MPIVELEFPAKTSRKWNSGVGGWAIIPYAHSTRDIFVWLSPGFFSRMYFNSNFFYMRHICLYTLYFTSGRSWSAHHGYHCGVSVKLYLYKTVREINWKQIISLEWVMIIIETTTQHNIAQNSTIQYSNFTEKIQFSKFYPYFIKLSLCMYILK